MKNRSETAAKILLLAMMLHNKLIKSVIQQTKFDLSPLQVHILGFLMENEPVTMTVLANEVRISKSQLTGFVDNLVLRGLVKRQFDNQDRRKINISITEAGQARLDNLEKERCGLLATELEALDDQNMSELESATAQLIRLIKLLPLRRL